MILSSELDFSQAITTNDWEEKMDQEEIERELAKRFPHGVPLVARVLGEKFFRGVPIQIPSIGAEITYTPPEDGEEGKN